MVRFNVCSLVIVAACGGGDPETASFEVVGHTDLGARGMNAAIAVAGTTVYVGSRIDSAGIAIVDVADPEHPAVVGEIARPFAKLPGMSSRELRVVPELDLLIVLNLQCSPELHGCAGGGEEEAVVRVAHATRIGEPPRVLAQLVEPA